LALQTDRRVFIVRKFVDVDGLYGAFISRAYARLSVAIAVGNCQRLEQWLLLLQTEPVLLVAAAPVYEEDEVVDEDEDADEVEEVPEEVEERGVLSGGFHRMS
jgi:hypothetical protein